MKRWGIEGVEVEYPPWRWRLLREKRRRALELVRALRGLGSVIVHGSISRGDVRETSDIDVVVLEPVPPSLVELALERAGLRPYTRLIVQATPSYVPKVYFIRDPEEERVVSVPLARLRPREREFYRWGGELGPEGLERGERVPGVSKELVLILPTERGHIEAEVIGMEHVAARILGVSIETVEERVRVLTRRRAHGRTGVLLKREVPPGHPVEEEVRRLLEENKFFRRAIERSS